MSGTKTEVIHFGIFRLDAAGQSLRRGEEEVPLRPKTWEVLRQLVGRPGQLITKDELIQRVWPGVAVTDGTLTQSIRELRAALQDDPKQPRFIATVHRRGYRFIATLEEEEQQAAAARPAQRTPLLVGRERELAALEGSLEAALRGRRGCVLVTGEAGVGKTSLIEAFLDAAARRHGDQLAVARGQCVEQRQDAEPYLPLLEALYQICRGRDGARFAELLRRFAPTWVVQIPWLLPPQELAALQQQLIGSGSERMLRELITALGEMASHAPLLIVLEDLHWSDLATLESIAALARRREPARLLLVGSMRAPAAASRAAAELRLALTTRSDASEIALDMLDAAAVRSYVRGRLGERTPEILLDAVVRHSGGSPLFLVTALTFASSQGWLSQTDGGCTLAITADELERALPVGLRQLIEAQVLGLAADDRELLQAASVAGIEVDAPILAVALGRSVDEMTAMLDQLSSRNRFLRRSATRQEPRPEPAAARFELTHALYHQVLYESLAPAKRRELHLAVGRALEVAYADRRSAVAADLARHYERGGAFLEAARYMGMAALNAHGRAADRESAALLEHALRLIGQLEDSPRRQRREADLCVQLGAVRGSIHGRGSEVYLEPFRRAWELAQELDDVPRMFIARMAAFGHFSLTEQLRQAEEVCRDLLALAARVPMPDLVAVANGAMGSVLFGRGRLAAAREHL
ncbi:MAG TPA: AAA family ATPase, partial [Terriglobales bacterium]|nr:AAA family ATPase [Terriglobales bacterium]